MTCAEYTPRCDGSDPAGKEETFLESCVTNQMYMMRENNCYGKMGYKHFDHNILPLKVDQTLYLQYEIT